jgi:lipopolysaccharide export system permease protein
MIKTYQKYLIKEFFFKIVYISFIFLSLVIILSILEEISFFKDLNKNIMLPIFLSLLNAPITLFEIFPFIFLLSTQFFFYDLIKNDELNLLKKNGLTNLNIIKIVVIFSLIIGLFNILVYYNLASNLKFYYTNIKNNFSKDNKYLAMVTGSGIWIKDEINDKILITNSINIENTILKQNTIHIFSKNFEIEKIIQSKKIDIKNNKWIIYNPSINIDNIKKSVDSEIFLITNFNVDKINSIFSDTSTLNLFKLYDLKKEYSKIGYSTDEIKIHLLKLYSFPIFYGVLTILSSIIMFNFTKKKSILFHITIGILTSVIIYYLNFIFNSLGANGKIPLEISVFFPMVIISLFSTIGLVNINEK